MDEEQSVIPWWGRGNTAIWTLGPVAVAFFIVLFVGFGWLPSPIMQSLADTNSVLAHSNTIMTDMKNEVLLHTKESREQQRAIITALRQICRNTAKNQQQNERCDDM